MNGSCRVVASAGQVSRATDDEAIILHLDAGMYFGLTEVGARIWQLLQEPRTVSEIRDRLLAEYAVEADQCEKDLVALLDDLAQRGLIEVKEA